jgi:DNA polymerase-3 subunit gamma/tau
MPEPISQAYYRKWRSKTFGDLVGQEPVARTLKNAVKLSRIAHAYLFCGPRGVGKTSAARILAKAINCPNVVDGEPCGTCETCRSIQEGRAIDVLELDAASNRGIDQIRDIREKVGLAPASLRTKFYILDEAHMITPDAFNALLKTLEEPPSHAIFVLVTTDPQKVPATIVSRCQQLDFRRISVADTVRQLRIVCNGEQVTPQLGVLEMVARASGGSLRDAEGALDQIVAYAGASPTVADARLILGSAGPESARNLLAVLLDNQVEEAIRLVNRLVDEGADPRQIAIDVVDVLRDVLLLRASDRLTDLVGAEDEALVALRDLARRLAPAQIVDLIRAFTPTPGTRAELRPQLPLEISIVEAAQLIHRRTGVAAATLPNGPPIDAPPLPDAHPVPQTPPPAPARSAPTPNLPAPPPTRSAPPVGTPTSQIEAATPPAPLADGPLTSSIDDGILFQTALNRWKEVLAACDAKNRPVQVLVSGARLLGVENGTLVLGFPFEAHRARMAEPARRTILEDAVRSVLGGSIRVRCVVADKSETVSTDPIQAANNDPIVRKAVELGARILRVSDPGIEEKQ